VDSGEVIGAYCIVYDNDGSPLKTDIMSYREIQSAWKKSKMNPILNNGQLKPGSTHAEYLSEMCRKTVINRCCKPIINSSSDRTLMEAVTRSEFVQAEENGQAEIDANANQEILDIEPEPPAEEPEPTPDDPDAELDAIIDGKEAASNGRMF
jgi:recombination protein RecT